MKLLAEQSNLEATEEIEEKNEYILKIYNRDESELSLKEESENKEKWATGIDPVRIK